MRCKLQPGDPEAEGGKRAARDQGLARSLPGSLGQGSPEPRAWSCLRDQPRLMPPLPEGAPAAIDRAWPRVTLVMPSLNQVRFLEEAILSVLNQRYPNLEFLLMDGGSTDGSLDIIRKYGEQITYWESEPDRGQAHAINKGWTRATGKYVGWLNSDDLLTPGSLMEAVLSLENQPTAEMLYGDLIRIDEQGKPLGVYRYHDFDPLLTIIRGDDIGQAGSLARKAFLDRTGYLDENLHFLLDKDLWLRITLAGGIIRHLSRPLALFRIHDEAKTQAGDPAAVEERYAINRRLFESLQLPEAIRKRKSSITAKMQVACARIYAKGGRYGPSLHEAGRAIRTDPFQGANPTWWWTIMLGLLGLAIGEQNWRRMRSWLRRVRLRLGRTLASGE